MIKDRHANAEKVYEGDFLTCVSYLKQGLCDYIYGPGGGILVLNSQKCLVYQLYERHIYFSAENYLSEEWKCYKYD